MIQKLKKSSGNIIGFELHRRLTDSEFQAFSEEVRAAISDKGKIRLLMIADYPQDFELKADRFRVRVQQSIKEGKPRKESSVIIKRRQVHPVCGIIMGLMIMAALLCRLYFC
jgi:hypothetical protein